jgi:hypothetical protein
MAFILIRIQNVGKRLEHSRINAMQPVRKIKSENSASSPGNYFSTVRQVVEFSTNCRVKFGNYNEGNVENEHDTSPKPTN